MTNRTATAYYPEHLEEHQWESDLDLMKQAGISAIRVFEFAWSRFQPNESTFTFDWAQRFLTLAQQKDMDVILCTPTAALPPWMMKQYPETVLFDKTRALPGSRRTYCFTSPKYREFGKRITSRMVSEFRKFKNIIAWQVDNELGFNFCKCGLCTDNFRSWLQGRFESIAALNKAMGLSFWSNEYSTWDEVGFYDPYGSPAMRFAEKEFFSWLVVGFLNEFVDLLHAEHARVPVTTNMMANFEQINYFEASKKLDFIAWDFYPDLLSTSGHSMANHLMRNLKHTKMWTLESTAGCLGNWQHIHPDHMNLLAIKSWAQGEEVNTKFAFRSFNIGGEQYIWGLLDHAGRPTRGYTATRELADIYKRLPETTDADFTADVAFIWGYENFWGYQTVGGNPNYYFTIDEYHKALNFLGVMVDVVSEKEDFMRYNVVIFPPYWFTDSDLAHKIGSFIEAGGVAVIGPQCFEKTRLNNYHDSPAPVGLTEVFGLNVREGCYSANYLGGDTSYLGCDAASMSAQPPKHDQYKIDSAIPALAESLAISYFELLEVTDAEVLAKYADGNFKGSAVLTRRKHGKGWAYKMGASFNQLGFDAIYRHALEAAGITTHKTVNAAVEVINLQRHRVYLNHSEVAVSEPITHEKVLMGQETNGQLHLTPFGFSVTEKS